MHTERNRPSRGAAKVRARGSAGAGVGAQGAAAGLGISLGHKRGVERLKGTARARHDAVGEGERDAASDVGDSHINPF